MISKSSILAFVTALALAGCSDDPRPDFTTDVQPTPREPLVFASPTACALDSDCEPGLFCFQGGCSRQCAQASDCPLAGATCTERGRCLSGSGSLGGGKNNIDVEPGVAITRLPMRAQQVAAGVGVVKVLVAVTPAPASGVLSYRIERTDGMGDPQKVYQAAGTTEFEIEVASGLADPSSAELRTVEANVMTSAGAFRLSLIPQLPLAGHYAGAASLHQFGQTGIPLDFYVVTDPPDASLEEASEAWVLLPVGPEKIFSPHPKTLPAGTAETMTRKLSWEGAPVNRWVAIFVSGYDLGPDSVVAAAGIPGQVRRTLRLEIEPYGTNEIIGKISDRWTGLYDARPDLGPSAPANVVFEGEIEMKRVGAAPLHTEINPPEEVPAGDPALLPMPSLAPCATSNLAVPDWGGQGCAALATLADFQAAPSDQQSACAVAVSRASLQGETTAREIAAFLNGTHTGAETFADFMKRCAAGTDGACRPTQAVLCGRQMAAYAYAGLEQDLASTPELVLAFEDTTREAFLGRQLGAFQTDAQTRMDWLETTDYPAIVTSQVKDLVGRLLDDWARDVLDVHLGVLSGQFDDSGLAVLSRSVAGEAALAARKSLLLEMSQSWRGASDALTLAAARWNQLYQDDPTRRAKAQRVSGHMFDLYLAAGLLTNFNRDSGASFASGTFAAGFGQLMRDLSQLMLPFDQLAYARDAEVVVSTSVDPSSDNTTLLRERREAAQAEIASAASAVGAILADAQAEALDKAELTNRMNNEISEVRSELVELCGLPVGCTPADALTDEACEVRAGIGQCGFLIDAETDDYLAFDVGAQSVSEAGSALLAVRAAILDHQRAQEEVRAHLAGAQLHLEATSAFARQVKASGATRRTMLEQMDAAIRARQTDRATALGTLLANITARNATRAAGIEATAAAMEEWGAVRLEGVKTSFDKLYLAAKEESAASGLFHEAELAAQWGEAVAAGQQTGADDLFGPARFAAMAIGLAAASGVTQVGIGLEAAAAVKQVQGEKALALSQAEVEALRDANALSDAITAADVAALEDEAELAAQQNQAEEAALQELLLMVEKTAEAELAGQRDLTELNDRRTALKLMLVQTAGLQMQVAQGELGLIIAFQEYFRRVQRAELRRARLEDLLRQRDEINGILGSPTAVFAWANRLEQAERRLQAAKTKLFDWLVALEYLAVRPFMDQRVQILLARNTYQLEAIADEVERLQGRCGGPVSRQSSELSLRDDLLGLTLPLVDSVTGEEQSPEQRLRMLLERGYVPIDKRVRYTSDSSVGGLLSSRSVLAATFTVSLDDFANLAAACNAKVYSLAVQLVGEGLGGGQPTVSILYDGSSELRSCQPGLEEYLDTIGRESTSFGAVTRLHAPGRSVSPVAGINQFPDNGGNVSLSGLPLASQYTVLIDPQLGENRNIDWTRLEDIKVRLEYSYQDLFPDGQCE